MIIVVEKEDAKPGVFKGFRGGNFREILRYMKNYMTRGTELYEYVF